MPDRPRHVEIYRSAGNIRRSNGCIGTQKRLILGVLIEELSLDAGFPHSEVKWREKPVFIRKRTEDQIASAKKAGFGVLAVML